MNCNYCETELRIIEHSNNEIIKLEIYCDSCRDGRYQYTFLCDPGDTTIFNIILSDINNKRDMNAV